MAQPNYPRLLHYAGAFFLLVASAALIYHTLQPRWFTNIRAEVTSQPYARTITVNGDAKVTSKPDLAIIALSVVTQGQTVKQVTTENNQKMNKIIDEIKKVGVEAKDITTSQYNLYPEYRYPDNRSPQITGYKLDQEISVKVRVLDKVEEVLDNGIKAGANQVGQLMFDIDDASPLKKEARELAFKAAKEKAQEMASAAGVRLGRVVTFSEGNEYIPPSPYPNMLMGKAEAMDVAQAPSIEPGSKELRINVSVTYEIE
jgi:uncharacterized protein YggE